MLEIDRTYRIPKEDGTTLLRILKIAPKQLLMLDLKTKRKFKQNRANFQRRLDNGEIFVAASLQQKLIAALRILNKTNVGNKLLS